MVGDGTWLSLGEVVAAYRAAGYTDSESTVRREIDEAIAAGELESYRPRRRGGHGGHRRVLASDVAALLAVRHIPPGPERDRALAEERTRRRQARRPSR